MKFSLSVLLLIGTFVFTQKSYAQSKTIPLVVKSADALQGFQKEGDSSYQKLIGNVQLEHQGTMLYCDSAIINLVLNDAEAFGDVLIVQADGTTISSDYVKYAGDKKLAIFRSNVTLTDGKNSLWTDSLDYQTQAKIGTYTTGGTLQTEGTTLSSEKGQYTVKTKDAIFEGDVVVTDPQFNCTSKKIGYNTQTKLIRILDHSKVVNTSSILISSNGIYDAKNEVGKFYNRSSAQNKEQYIEADTLEYNRKSNWSIAKGKVIAKDTAQHITLYAGWASYQESIQKMIAYLHPVMKIEQDNDSFFLSADTFLIAPLQPILIDKKKKIAKNSFEEELPSDTLHPKFYKAYYHVSLFSDSLQASADSLYYNGKDSVLKCMIKPVLWSRNAQLTGDTISLYFKNGQIDHMYVPNNALIASQAGPVSAKLYDQIQGSVLKGNFENNALKDVWIYPNTTCIYYPKDDSGAFVGVNQSSAERMHIYFAKQSISKIIFQEDVKQTITPLQEINLNDLFLSKFKWLPERRPKVKPIIFK
jgi:lipopolysaccharide export system protein LptA